MNDKLRQILVISTLSMTLVVNALANILPINGFTTGELSDGFAILFVPAGYVFSIWAVIYSGLIAYVVFQTLSAQRDNPRLKNIAPWFIASSFFNSGWIFAWHYQQVGLSLVLMLGILLSLIMIYQKLGIGLSRVNRAETLTTRLPFSIYLGWITVATVANVSTYLYKLNWNAFNLSSSFWAITLLLIATGIGLTILNTRRDIAYASVLMWAFAGITLKHWTAQGFALTAVVMTIILGFAIVLLFVRRQPELTTNRARLLAKP